MTKLSVDQNCHANHLVAHQSTTANFRRKTLQTFNKTGETDAIKQQLRYASSNGGRNVTTRKKKQVK